MDTCHVCGQSEAEFGCHGVVNGAVVSFSACAAHKGWEWIGVVDVPMTDVALGAITGAINAENAESNLRTEGGEYAPHE